MDSATLFAILRTIGLPVAYHHFLVPPSTPYLIYLEAESDAWGSDDRNEVRRTGYRVELYTTKKDLAAQRLVESLFNERGIEYSLNEVFIETEGLYQAAYTIEFTTKIRRN